MHISRSKRSRHFLYMPQYLLLRQIKATKVASLFFLGGAELKGAALVVAVSDAESALHFILKGA